MSRLAHEHGLPVVPALVADGVEPKSLRVVRQDLGTLQLAAEILPDPLHSCSSDLPGGASAPGAPKPALRHNSSRISTVNVEPSSQKG